MDDLRSASYFSVLTIMTGRSLYLYLLCNCMLTDCIFISLYQCGYWYRPVPL